MELIQFNVSFFLPTHIFVFLYTIQKCLEAGSFSSCVQLNVISGSPVVTLLTKVYWTLLTYCIETEWCLYLKFGRKQRRFSCLLQMMYFIYFHKSTDRCVVWTFQTGSTSLHCIYPNMSSLDALVLATGLLR